MVLTLHHLGISQSERIVFLLEELGMEYNLVKYTRDPLLAPASFKSLPGNHTGSAPFFEDPEARIALSESGAIADYILAKYASEGGKIRLTKNYGDPGYSDYIYYFHFANATLQPALARVMLLGIGGAAEDNPMVQYATHSMHQAFKILEDHLGTKKWLAGDDFTAADCMMVYSLTTQRYFGPLVGYEKYPNIVRYLKDVGERSAYRRAMEKGDPEMQLLLGAEAPKKSLLEVGGVVSNDWKKM